MRSADEIRSLTGLRGIAAVYVVLFHYFPLKAFANPVTRFLDHGYLAVDLFFVLSGFVMAMNYGHMFEIGCSKAAYLRFLGRRIARIYPLYIVATVAALVLVLGGLLEAPQPLALGLAFALNAIMVQTWGLVESFDPPAWSISAEWAAYLLFPLLIVPTLFRRPAFGWIAGLLCVLTIAALCTLPASMFIEYSRQPLNINDHFLALPVVRCIAEFMLGLLAFRVAGTSLGRRVAASGWISPLLCLATLALMAIPKSDLAVVLLFPALVVSVASGTHVPSRILSSSFAEWLGKLSYSVYLTHYLLSGLLLSIDLRVQAAGIGHAWIYAAFICLALTFLLSFVAYRTIETPGRRWLREVFEGRPGEKIRAVQSSTG